MLYKKLLLDFDYNQLLNECQSIIDKVGWHNNQISLQYSKEPSWSADVDIYGFTRLEHKCDKWNPDMEGSYIKKVIDKAGVPVASARLMLLRPISCYITHVDLYNRYQIPIQIEPLKSFFVFNEHNEVVTMHPGDYYWFNTREIHNFINGAYTDRITLIFNDARERPQLDNPHIKRLFKDFDKEVTWR